MTIYPDEDTLIRRSPAPRISLEMIEQQIIAEHYFTAYEGRMGSIVEGTYTTRGRQAGTDQDLDSLKLLTFCLLVLENGYTVVGQSACADARNFDRAMGEGIARKEAINQIWPLLGYELKTRIHREDGRNLYPISA